jgi:hypothetical protein
MRWRHSWGAAEPDDVSVRYSVVIEAYCKEAKSVRVMRIDVRDATGRAHARRTTFGDKMVDVLCQD